MKAIAYSIKPYEKESLAKANQKKHDITLISNSLGPETAIYADGKEAVIVFTNDDVSETVIQKLSGYGIKYIVTRSAGIDHIDTQAAKKEGIKVAHMPALVTEALTSELLQAVADQTITNLDLWQQKKCIGSACACAAGCKKL